MTDRPPETALDRLRARLVLRQEAPPPAETDSSNPEPSPAPSAAAAPPQDDPPPMDEPAGRSDPARRFPEAPPAGPDTVEETIRRYELSRTRLRINLTWAMAVMLAAAVFATAAYLHPSRIPDELFSRLWPWRAHVWNVYGGGVIWCINEARKRNGPFACNINFDTYGPDCPRPETGAVTAAHRCPPWETWPTDPAPRWSADGPPRWSR